MGGPAWTCHVCPSTQPTNATACNEQGAKCLYGSTECACTFGQWDCGTCPAAQPADNSTCTGLTGLTCDYSSLNCTCMPGPMGGGDRWRCVEPCPATQPQPGGTCQTANQVCAYGSTSCLCVQGQFFCN
jgi:hypothetical protein